MEIKYLQIVFFYFLCMWGYLGYTQVGYLGKRMYTKYDLTASPALLNPNYNNLNRLNSVHTITMGTVLSNKQAIEIGIGYARTGLKYEGGYSDIGYVAEPVSTIGYSKSNSELKIISYAYSLKYVISSRGHAPLGGYIALGVTYLQNFLVEDFENQDLYFFEKTNSLMPTLNVGNKRIFNHFLLVDYGIGTGFNSGIISSLFSTSPNGELIRQAHTRLNSFYFLQLKLGIGLVY